MLAGEPVYINGTGDTSRDFCYVANVVQANILAATAPGAAGQAFNIALDDRTTLTELFYLLRDRLAPHVPAIKNAEPVYGPYRKGDVMHSQADITKARRILGYEPIVSFEEGLRRTVDWYRTATIAAAR